MVYCTKCGAENPDDQQNCSKCGSPLNPPSYRAYGRYRVEDEACFGGRNYIWGVIIGLFIIMIGASSLLGGNMWDMLWPVFIILLGVVIIASALIKKK
jgi:uncharacterized membrane protein YvbJ